MADHLKLVPKTRPKDVKLALEYVLGEVDTIDGILILSLRDDVPYIDTSSLTSYEKSHLKCFFDAWWSSQLVTSKRD